MEGRGRGYYILALRVLDYMGFAMEAKRNGRWGGTNCSPTALGLGISGLVLDWMGAQKCFILHDQTAGDLKSHHLQARATLTAMSVPPRPPFLSAELWINCDHLGNLGIIMHTVYTHNII